MEVIDMLFHVQTVVSTGTQDQNEKFTDFEVDLFSNFKQPEPTE